MGRFFNANPPKGRTRCEAVVTLRDKSTASCMRRAVRGGLCEQHARIAEERQVDLREQRSPIRPPGVPAGPPVIEATLTAEVIDPTTTPPTVIVDAVLRLGPAANDDER